MLVVHLVIVISANLYTGEHTDWAAQYRAQNEKIPCGRSRHGCMDVSLLFMSLGVPNSRVYTGMCYE